MTTSEGADTGHAAGTGSPSPPPATTSEGAGIRHAALFVERVTLRDFKGIKNLTVDLRPRLTLLVGRNNVGKSRILRALQIAVGGAPVERDDLTVGLDAPAEIDVLIAPHPTVLSHVSEHQPASGSAVEAAEEVFDESLQGVLGDQLALISTDPARQRYSWRTIIEAASEGSGARSQTQVLAYSVESNEWQQSVTPLPRQVRRLVHAELVDTRRDLDAELRRRGTAVRRILNDLRVQDPDRQSLEQQLADLGDEILGHSLTLQELRNSLNSLDLYVDAVGAARVDPVPRTLEELAHTVGVSFDDGAAPLASRLHGSGVLSLASLLVQDVFYRQTLGADSGDIRPHPVALMEEPEAHLHPHAILEIAGLLESVRRQVVATTHSPLLASSVSPLCLQLLRQDDTDGCCAIDFGPAQHGEDERRTKNPCLYADEMEKLKRLVERPFGELLFAHAVVIGDGATERGFLPPVLRAALGPRAHGISVIDSAGMQNELVEAVIKFARHTGLRLVVFADSDTGGAKRIQSLASEDKLHPGNEVVCSGARSTTSSSSKDRQGAAIEKMLIEAAPEACMAAGAAMGTPTDNENGLLAIMKKHKGTIGAALAQEFLQRHPYGDGADWPEPLRQLTSLLREKNEDSTAASREAAP